MYRFVVEPQIIGQPLVNPYTGLLEKSYDVSGNYFCIICNNPLNSRKQYYKVYNDVKKYDKTLWSVTCSEECTTMMILYYI